MLDQYAKAKRDVDEPQQPDHRARELSGDTAYELRGERNEDETWELSGDMAHELRHGRHGDEVEEIVGG